ncbi:MAG: FkbM family methyltransferase [Gemmatimonadales bacterium]
MIESVTHLLRRLTFNPRLTAMVRGLGLRHFARRVYYRLNADRDGEVALECRGLRAVFPAPDPVEFRTFELAWLNEEPVVTTALEHLGPGDVFFDVGGNRGLFAVFAGLAVGNSGMVVAFEPESRAFAALQQNVALNGLSNVQCLKVALSDRRCEMALAVPDADDLSQTAHLVAGASPGAMTETVDVWPGDALVTRHDLPQPSAIKIDVEGHEFEVLRGLQRTLVNPACRLVICELHPAAWPSARSTASFEALLQGYGFQHVELRARHTTPQLIARRGR